MNVKNLMTIDPQQICFSFLSAQKKKWKEKNRKRMRLFLSCFRKKHTSYNISVPISSFTLLCVAFPFEILLLFSPHKLINLTRLGIRNYVFGVNRIYIVSLSQSQSLASTQQLTIYTHTHTHRERKIFTSLYIEWCTNTHILKMGNAWARARVENQYIFIFKLNIIELFENGNIL